LFCDGDLTIATIGHAERHRHHREPRCPIVRRPRLRQRQLFDQRRYHAVQLWVRGTLFDLRIGRLTFLLQMSRFLVI
jgi:hypothetical protein